MAKQHEDSVWPYVYSGMSLSEEEGFTIKLYNKGIGPALFEGISIKYEDIYNGTWQDLLIKLKFENTDYSCSGAGVLTASENQIIFQVSDYETAQKVFQVLNTIDIEIIYCSIHQECWEVKSGERNKIKPYDKKSIKCS